MDTLSDESVPRLESFLEKRKKQLDQSSAGKIFVNDECGDSMWDEVLAQHDENLSTKNSGVNEDLPNKAENVPESDANGC